MKNKKIIVALSLVIAGLLFWLGTNLYKKNESERLGFMAEQDFSIFVRPHSPRMGNKSAKVYLVEFFDPECESCREFYPFVKSLLSEFDGKVQLVLRYATYHQNSAFAVKILEASGKQGKYWETLNLLFETQPHWGDHHDPRPEIIWQYLPGLGLDVEKIRADLEDPSVLKIIDQDRIDGMQLGVRGTPTFFVNGKPLDYFGEEALRAALKQAIDS